MKTKPMNKVSDPGLESTYHFYLYVSALVVPFTVHTRRLNNQHHRSYLMMFCFVNQVLMFIGTQPITFLSLSLFLRRNRNRVCVRNHVETCTA